MKQKNNIFIWDPIKSHFEHKQRLSIKDFNIGQNYPGFIGEIIDEWFVLLKLVKVNKNNVAWLAKDNKLNEFFNLKIVKADPLSLDQFQLK